jgi:3-hydroxyisobutyrate dehydrogenase-like beta-hydroxyacid dehydrogenase
MGLQTAARLLDTGHDVAIYNRAAAKAALIVSRRAVAVERSADLADRDVVFTMVSGSDDLLQITTGADGVPRTEDFSTLIPEQARRCGIDLAAENVKVDDGLEAR